MSLEELLKDSDNSSAWKGQRKKLVRIIVGVLIITLALTAVVIILISIKRNNNIKEEASILKTENAARSLAQLMQVQKEAEGLKEELDILRKTTSVQKVNSKNIQNKKKKIKVGGANDLEAPQIINFEPGKGFESLGVENSDLYIPTGAVFRARLITPIKTSLAKTFVMAETTNEFRMDMKRRIPKGSRLIGRSRLNPVLKGVIVEFDTLVLPTGIETRLSGLALSRNALPEIDGLYFSDNLQNYGTALAFGFLSGFADAAKERELTALGSQPQVSLGNQVLAGLSTASFQVADEILQDIRNRAIEYVVVPGGEPVFVALTSRYNISSGGQK